MQTLKKQIEGLLAKFNELKVKKFSNNREHGFDDIFGDLIRLRSNLPEGSKRFEDSTHRGVRSRVFSYDSDDGKIHVYFRIAMIQGQPGQTTFEATATFLD